MILVMLIEVKMLRLVMIFIGVFFYIIIFKKKIVFNEFIIEIFFLKSFQGYVFSKFQEKFIFYCCQREIFLYVFSIYKFKTGLLKFGKFFSLMKFIYILLIVPYLFIIVYYFI